MIQSTRREMAITVFISKAKQKTFGNFKQKNSGTKLLGN